MIYFVKHLTHCLALVLILTTCAQAQTDVKADTSITHTVAEGETLSDIAKSFGTSVGNIMRLNGMNSKSLLVVGSVIKIKGRGAINEPANAIASQKNTQSTGTYIVQPKDGLYSLSKKYKVTVDQLKEWNGLSSNDIKIGQVLIVSPEGISKPLGDATKKTGPLVTKPGKKAGATTLSTTEKIVAKQPTAPKDEDSPPIPPTSSFTPIKDTLVKKDSKNLKKGKKKPAAPPTLLTDTAVAFQPISAQPTEIKKPFMARDTTEQPIKANDSADNSMSTTPIELVEPQIKALGTPKKAIVSEKDTTTIQAATSDEQGYFAKLYDSEHPKDSLVGDAATFKSLSGWLDKKYYVLVSNILPGTIVKIVANNKTICAKVLSPLPDIKEDTGIIARINNAGALALGFDETKFAITLYY